MYQLATSSLMRLEIGMTVCPIVQHNGIWQVGAPCQIVAIDDDDSVYLVGAYSGRFSLCDVATTPEHAGFIADRRNHKAA